MARSIEIFYEKLKSHLRDNMKTYYLILLFAILGLGVGLYLTLTGYKNTSLLVTDDKLLFDYITGTASYLAIFYTRLKTMLLSVLIILLCNLTYYTGFINYIYLVYQSSLIVLSCSGIISLYRLSGILNVIFFTIPVNVLNIITLSYLIAISLERSREMHKYKTRFIDSFKQSNYFIKLGFGVLFMLLQIFISSFILPLFMRSLTTLIY